MLTKEDIKENIKIVRDKIIEDRRNLHKIPEIGLKLPKTKNYIKNRLDMMGLTYHETKDVDGLYGLIEGRTKDKIIALRSDMDALPISEKTGLPFASDNGNMHACGHDGHMSIMLSTLEVLNNIKEQLNGSIMFIFQSGEEGYLGAEKMLNEGLFEIIKPDIIFSLHIGSIFNELENGQIGIAYGKVMSSLDTFKLEIIGKEAHGAEPHKSKDPFIPTAEILLGVQSIISREIDTKEKSVLSFGKIQGGTASNIIPSNIILEGTVRSVSQDIRDYINKRINEVSYYIAKAYDIEVKYEYTYGAPVLENNNELVKMFIEVLKENISNEEYKILENPTMIGEDFSFYLQEVPGFYYFYGSKKLVDDEYHAHHTEKFDIDDENLYKVVYMNIMFILKYFSN